jgi:hypothetical protein
MRWFEEAELWILRLVIFGLFVSKAIRIVAAEYSELLRVLGQLT